MVARCARTMASATRCASSAWVALAGLDGVQRLAAPVERLGIVLVVGGGAGVEVPAEVVEADGGVGDEAAHVRGRLVLQVVEAHHHVGHLHAGVVDVVLHLHVAAEARSMRTKVSPSTALRRWPMCAALLGLMLVCSTMIFSPGAGCGSGSRVQQRSSRRGAVEAHVDVAVAGHFHGGDARDGPDGGHQVARRACAAAASVGAPVGRRRARRGRRTSSGAAVRAQSENRRRTVSGCWSGRLPGYGFQVYGTREKTSIAVWRAHSFGDAKQRFPL